MSFENLLDSRVTIKRASASDDGQGGKLDPSYSVLYRRVKARFETLDEKKEVVAHDREATYPDYYVYMQYRGGIKEGDYVFLGSRRFLIMLVEDWSEQGKYLRLSVMDESRDE